LFLAMGATAAYQVGAPTFSIFETGVGCLNLPTSRAQVGAQGTRAMHPKTLSLFNRLAEIVLDRPVAVIAPFFLHTKGELCRLSGPALPKLASVSMSCDEGEGHKSNPMEHCGLCTSCLFRRVALHAVGTHSDPTVYRDQQTSRHGIYELRALENHAEELASADGFDNLLDLDPDVRFAPLAPVIGPGEVQSSAAVFAMYKRYAMEVRAFLEKSRPTVTEPSKQPRKERNRDLFSATR
jgi:hypothetical protein